MKDLTNALLTLYLITFTPIFLFSQVPQKIDFQAIARDAEGIPIASQDIGVKIAIVKDSIGGTVVYEQADTLTTDISGLFTLKIGEGNAITGNFTEINWGSTSYYTQVSVDKDGGANYVDMGAMEMVSVPYALYSEKSGTSYWDSIDNNIFFNGGNVGIQTSIPMDHFQIGDSTSMIDQTLSIQSQKDVAIILAADMDNDNLDENENPYILLKQDGFHISSILGIVGDGNFDPQGSEYENTIANATLLGTLGNDDLQIGTNQEVRVTILESGEVGIGTTSPGYKLQVGDPGDGTEARANAWNSLSDRRLKREFNKIDDPIGKLSHLNGYYYYWLEDKPDQTRQIGVTAQEVDKVLPELVSADEDGIKSVNYSKLTALLIEVNKVQQENISELQKEIEILKSKVAALEE